MKAVEMQSKIDLKSVNSVKTMVSNVLMKCSSTGDLEV